MQALTGQIPADRDDLAVHEHRERHVRILGVHVRARPRELAEVVCDRVLHLEGREVRVLEHRVVSDGRGDRERLVVSHDPFPRHSTGDRVQTVGVVDPAPRELLEHPHRHPRPEAGPVAVGRAPAERHPASIRAKL
jgi:hypothetical protein